MPTPDGFASRTVRKETFHTLSFVERHLRQGDVVLDIGCGTANVTWQLAQRHHGEVLAIDIVDCRRRPTPHFALYDGVTLPFAAQTCDVAMLNFVLHHIPNDVKPQVLAEVHRVTRRHVIVLEDTPRNRLDRYFNRRHGERFRRQIASTADYGFYSHAAWSAVFEASRFAVTESRELSRFSRAWTQPYARSCFVLERR